MHLKGEIIEPIDAFLVGANVIRGQNLEHRIRIIWIEREVMKVEEDDAEELKEAAEALVEYLRKKQTPMTTAIVTGAGVEILSTEIHVSFEEEWD